MLGLCLLSFSQKEEFCDRSSPSHKKWKQRFVFIEFPPDQFPFSNLEWTDRIIKPERVHPEPTLELEDACEKLLNGDPMTGKPYVYGGWVYRLLNPNGGVSATHDAEDDRDNSPDGYAETSSLHPDMNFTGIANLDESNDEVLLGDRSSINKPPSPPQVSKMEGATTSQCTPLHDLIWDKKVKSPSAINLSEGDRADPPKSRSKPNQKGPTLLLPVPKDKKGRAPKRVPRGASRRRLGH